MYFDYCLVIQHIAIEKYHYSWFTKIVMFYGFLYVYQRVPCFSRYLEGRSRYVSCRPQGFQGRVLRSTHPPQEASRRPSAAGPPGPSEAFLKLEKMDTPQIQGLMSDVLWKKN